MKVCLPFFVAFFAVLALLVAPVSAAYASPHGKPPCHQSKVDDAKSLKLCCTVLCYVAVVPLYKALPQEMQIQTIEISEADTPEEEVLPPLLGPPRS